MTSQEKVYVPFSSIISLSIKIEAVVYLCICMVPFIWEIFRAASYQPVAILIGIIALIVLLVPGLIIFENSDTIARWVCKSNKYLEYGNEIGSWNVPIVQWSGLSATISGFIGIFTETVRQIILVIEPDKIVRTSYKFFLFIHITEIVVGLLLFTRPKVVAGWMKKFAE